MALASYFDKTLLAASSVLSGCNPRAFTAVLERHVVGIAFDDKAAGSPEGQVLLDLLVNILARLYPVIGFHATGAVAEALTGRFVEHAQRVNRRIELERDYHQVTAWIVVGGIAPPSPLNSIFLLSYVWLSKVSASTPLTCSESTNPFGAAGAACLGAANLFRVVFGESLAPAATVDQDVIVSVLDLDPSTLAPLNPPLGAVDLREVVLVGAGAIGNAALWTLARTSQVNGKMHIVDGEAVDLTNVQRYVLTDEASVGVPKASLAAAALAGTAIDTHPHPVRWGAYLRERENWRFDRVAVALDSAEDRIRVQGALPRWIVNAWTQTSDLGVSRHTLVGPYACLACLYLPAAPRKNLDEVVQEALGLKGQPSLEYVRRLLYTREPVGERFLVEVASALGISDATPLMRFATVPLLQFYQQGVCGGEVVRLRGAGSNQPPELQAEVPLAFQSALAGVLLAAALVADAASILKAPPPVVTRANLLRPLGPQPSQPIAKHPSGRCICQDADYIAAYEAKYR